MKRNRAANVIDIDSPDFIGIHDIWRDRDTTRPQIARRPCPQLFDAGGFIGPVFCRAGIDHIGIYRTKPKRAVAWVKRGMHHHFAQAQRILLNPLHHRPQTRRRNLACQIAQIISGCGRVLNRRRSIIQHRQSATDRLERVEAKRRVRLHCRPRGAQDLGSPLRQ